MKERFKFSEMLQRLEHAKVDMPLKIAEAGQKYFKANFRKQQSPDGEHWKPRVRETASTKGKPILFNTGTLYEVMSHTIIAYDYKKITWGVDLKYAPYLNYGTSKMVARPFIADGKEIRGKIKGVIKREFDKIMFNR